MDFSRIFFKSNYKSNMGAHIPQSYTFGHCTFAGQSTGFHSFAKETHMPYKSNSYPDCFSKFSPQNMFQNAMKMTRTLQSGKGMDNLAPSLTRIVNGVLGPSPIWNTAQKVISDNLEMLNDIVSNEITRTMSCPDAFNYYSPPPPEAFSEPPQDKSQKQDFTKMSYADVAKMNLSNINKNNINVNKSLDSNTISSHRNNIFGVKKEKKVSSPQPYEYVNRYHGTNSTRGEQLQHKNKYHHKNSRKPHRKMQPSLKRELGTKKNNQNMDLDGSMWGRENVKTFEDSPSCCTDTPHAPLIRVRSISSESDCSSEVSECLKNPRVRSISECSVNSIDSDDSFIVFDDCVDDGMYDSYEEESSDEDNECSPVSRSCDGLQQSDYLKCINSKWNNLSPKNIPSNNLKNLKNNSQNNNCPLSPALKKVRFACGEALAKVRKLCVWDYAHRAARIGPWEQAARDRSRFSSRVSSLAPVLNPILDPKHRSKIYDLRFAST